MLELLLALVAAPALAALAILLANLVTREPGERAVAGVAFPALILGLLGAVGLAGARAAGLLPVEHTLGSWLQSGEDAISVGVLLDAPGLALLVLGASASALVARFSRAYLHREPGFARFFALLCLFQAAWALMCLSSEAPLTYAGWEGVGLCSALLIGYFYERPEAAAAGARAFATNRVGDAGFLLGLLLALDWLGGARWTTIAAGASGLSVASAAAVAGCFLLAAMVKGGVLPFSSWLGRAMEGPTPSSALFYGAVAVNGGVLLLLRVQPLLEIGTPAAAVAVVAGLGTALYGLAVGLAQPDIKSRLVFSSMAQLGLVLCWCGLGFERLALVHAIGHGVLRGWQLLRAPSVVALRAAVPARPVPAALARSRLATLAAQSRFWMDELTAWAVVAPLRRLARELDAIDTAVIDRATGLPLRRAPAGLATLQESGRHVTEPGLGRGVAGRLAQWTAGALARVEDRLVLKAIGQGIPEAGGRLGRALGRVELLLARPWVLVLVVVVTLLAVW